MARGVTMRIFLSTLMKAAQWVIPVIAVGALAMAGLRCRLPLEPLHLPASAMLSAIGVTANFIGGYLLWIYGIPNRVNRDGHMFFRTIQTDENEIRRARFYDLMSNLGLALLIVGFFIQLLDVLQSC